MSFMGELSDIGVADILYLLALRRQTGKLTVSANGDEVTLYLDRGQLSSITSTNLGLRLGRMLVRLGYLTVDQLQEALQEQERGERARSLGTIVLERGWIAENNLRNCIEEQCIEILARVIASDRGIFTFQRGATLPKRTESVALNTDHIVLEATRRSDELIELRRLLPDPTALLMLSLHRDEAANALSDAEVLVAMALQGNGMSLAELGQRLGWDERTLLRTVVQMRERGLILAATTGYDESRPAAPSFQDGDARSPANGASCSSADQALIHR
ncbi:MAG: hypothetical protein C4346_18575 [Chloroflexota bacterium]